MNSISPDEAVLPTIADIDAAALRLIGASTHTPLLESEALSKDLGGRVLFKAEGQQSVGSFKIRGAYNMISQLPAHVRKRGVVAFSSGNHAQAVAAVAALFKIPATIIMPSDAPTAKIEGTRSRGAEVVLYDRAREDRETIAIEHATKRGATIVPPFDHPHIIAGQGTVGLEIVTDCLAWGIVPDIILVPCSGGGLVAGIGIAVKNRWPEVSLIACEPEGYDDTALSLAAGQRVPNESTTPSLCDALMVNMPGKMTFAINGKLLTRAVAVADSEVLAAMKVAKNQLDLVVEPGGAIGLAALLSGAVTLEGCTAVVVLSGSNVDSAVLDQAMTSTPLAG